MGHAERAAVDVPLPSGVALLGGRAGARGGALTVAASSFLSPNDPDPAPVATPERARFLLRDLEARAEIDSLERLHHRRRVLVKKLAKLEALYGPFGLADSYRRQMRGVIATELRGGGQKLTKDAAEDAAAADPRYRKLLDAQRDGAARYRLLKVRVTEIEELIRNRDLALQTYNKELGLQPMRGGR